MKVDLPRAIALMGRKPANPIGTCFDAAAFQLVFASNPPNTKLCHAIGIANMPGQEGAPIGHAWVEADTAFGRVALDPIWHVIVPVAKMRDGFTYIVEYSKAEALALWKETDFPGPWDARIAELVKTPIEKRRA